MVNSQIIKHKLISSSLLKNDPSINTKLYDDNTIDLKKWCYDEDILKFLSDENINKLVVDIKYNPNEIAKKLSDSKTSDEFLKICNEVDIYISKNEINSLNSNFEKHKKIVFERIHDDLILGNKKFLKIKREADRRFNDESVWYLYIGAYFLTGKTIDGDIIRAPLMLYKVSISNINGELNIIKKEKEVTINEKLNLFLKQNYDIEIKIGEHINVKEINKILEYLKPITNDIKFDFLTNNKICDFSNLSMPEDKFIIEPSVVYGLSDPCGGIVLMDYEKIIKSCADPFDERSIISHASEYENQIINDDDLIMFNRQLNIFQKYAVKSALNESSLIMGPPGTGKSEVIATIIANIIHNDKTILMVSEKKAALDVLEERLLAIGDICLFAYNVHDEQYFYNKIKKIHDLINEDVNELSIPNCRNAYEKIKDIYKDMNYISTLNINDKNIEDLVYISEDKRKFDKKTFDFILDITKITNEKNLNIIYQQYYHLFKKISQYKNYFPKIINRDELLDLQKLANESRHKDLIYKNYFVNHKIQKFIFSFNNNIKLHSFSNEILENLITLVDDIVNTKIQIINVELLTSFNNLNPNDIKNLQNEFDSYILDTYIEKNEYLSKPILDTIFNNYVLAQKRIVKGVDEIIKNNYINKLKKWIKDIESSNDEKTKSELKELFRISALKVPMPINQTIKKYYHILRIIFPIWILNPTQTSQVTPCEPGIFDYGIFDEASQMFYENSYPLVYRVKNSIVCGDDKQLSPIGNFATKSFDDSYISDIDNESNIVSLFEKASTLSWPNYQLKNHYRSSSYDLISFANKYIYNDEMKVVTKNNFFSKSVITYNVNGVMEDNVNNIEINKVIDIIVDKFNNNDYQSSLLVIAFNNKQMQLLEYEFNQRIGNLSQRALEAYRNKNLMFGSIENIQGLEADDVIISFTYAKNSKGVLATDFKPISEEGGISRLNVAITRAKNEMIIVKSIFANDSINTSNTDLNIFIKFIEWCDKINTKPTIADVIKVYKNNDYKNLSSDFEIDVCETINKLIFHEEYKIVTKLEIGTAILDICIVNKKNQEVVLGIICDDYSYKSNLKKMIENLDSQKLLEDRGYPTYRITLIEWKTKNNIVLNELTNLIKNFK